MRVEPYVIVVGVDFEPDGDLAFDEAIRGASLHGDAEVHVLYVDSEARPEKVATDEYIAGVSVAGSRLETALDRLQAYARRRVALWREAEPEATFKRVVTHFRIGKPAQMLIQLAVDLDADLIIVGTHNRKGIKRLILGSVAETVVHQARCPVQVVRKKDHLDLGGVPEIEAPCQACLETRMASNGAVMWCARHALSKYRPRVHRMMAGGSGDGEPEPWSQATPQV
jgi:nucleotide-binding universal stress UspA family protein